MEAQQSEILREVFAAAVKARWTVTNLGRMASVSASDGYTWTVLLRPMGRDRKGNDVPVRAEIFGREGWGGSEFATGVATWGQSALIVDAAMAAGRV
ncbi:hypothetical protein [Embleya sp. NPDC001921]